MHEYFGGIEGGTTNSRMIIVNRNGQLLGKSEGPHTNHWHIGLVKTVQRLLNLIDEALIDASLPRDTRLKTLGLSLSGVNTVENQNAIVKIMYEMRPKVADRIQACNDAVGTLATATDDNAIVLIAGTGSICKLIRRSMSFVRFGGLGYLLGDEGSAFWIAHRAITCLLKIAEGLEITTYDIEPVRTVIFDHFQIKHHQGILKFFNERFDKTFIARLCKNLADLALQGNQFCIDVFYDAGYELGRHVSAAVRYADKEGLMTDEGIEVICCGSVFKSWSLLVNGFRQGLQPRYPNDCRHGRLRMFLLKKTAAFGAAIVAAKLEFNINLPRPADTTRFLCDIELMENSTVQ